MGHDMTLQTHAATGASSIRQISCDQCEWFQVLTATILLLLLEQGVSFLRIGGLDNFPYVMICSGILYISAYTAFHVALYILLTRHHQKIGDLLEKYGRITRSVQHKFLRFLTYFFSGAALAVGALIFDVFVFNRYS